MELKKRWPINGGPRIDNFAYALAYVWDDEKLEKYNYSIQPKCDNMPTRVLLVEKEKAKISDKKEKNFLSEPNGEFMMGSYYKIFEKTEDTLSLKEGKVFFLKNSNWKARKNLLHKPLYSQLGADVNINEVYLIKNT